MKFMELKEGDRFRYVNAAMFNSGVWTVKKTVPAGTMTGIANLGHYELITRADREVDKIYVDS